MLLCHASNYLKKLGLKKLSFEPTWLVLAWDLRVCSSSSSSSILPDVYLDGLS